MRYRWLPGLAWSHSHSERTNWNRARGPCRRLRSALHLHTLNRVAPLSPRGHTISPTTTEEYSDEGKDVSEEEILRSSLQLPRPPIPGHNVQRSRDEIRANFLRIRPTTHNHYFPLQIAKRRAHSDPLSPHSNQPRSPFFHSTFFQATNN